MLPRVTVEFRRREAVRASVRPWLLGLAICLSASLPVAGCTGEDASAPAEVGGSRRGAAEVAVGGELPAGFALPEEVLDRRRETGLRVVVVGIDGATFTVLAPLLEEGRLPNLQRLIRDGALGVLRSEPPMRSPALWTTLATGRARSDHGVVHFTAESPETDDPILVNSTLRRRLTIWDVVGAGGHRVGVAGWWATWPAEPVHGWLVSDRLARGRMTEWTGEPADEHLTHPPELAAELRPLIVDPLDPPMAEIRRLVELTPEEERAFLSFRRPLFAHWLSVFKFAYCSQRTYERVFLELLGRGQPDLAAVFLVANDPVSHTFWHFHRPAEFGLPETERSRRLGALVPALQRHNDRFLGDVLELVDERTVVILVSDHGFGASGELPRTVATESAPGATEDLTVPGASPDTVTVGQSGAHHPEGIFVAGGGPVVPGSRVEADLYDLAPTVLALLGYPVPEEMPGRVLEEILEPGFLAEHPPGSLPSYESVLDRNLLRVDVDSFPTDESALEMLRALGYIR